MIDTLTSDSATMRPGSLLDELVWAWCHNLPSQGCCFCSAVCSRHESTTCPSRMKPLEEKSFAACRSLCPMTWSAWCRSLHRVVVASCADECDPGSKSCGCLKFLLRNLFLLRYDHASACRTARKSIGSGLVWTGANFGKEVT